MFDQSRKESRVAFVSLYTYSPAGWFVDEFWDFRYFRAESANLTNNILYAVQNAQGMSLELTSDVGVSLQHAVIYGGITGLWLTDSDDAQEGINVDTGLFSVAVSLKDGKLYLEGEGNWYENPNREGIYVDYCFALNPDAASDWGLLVPESATATLGLMALPGLAARRRRR